MIATNSVRAFAIALAFVLTLGASGSDAATMTFEGLLTPGATLFPIPEYTEAGFTLHGGGVFSAASAANTNGSDIFGWCGYCNEPDPVVITLKASAGGPFSLLSLDAANLERSYRASGFLHLIGEISGGGTVLQDLTITDDWQTFAVSGFNGLDSVRIFGDVGHIGFDFFNPADPAMDNLVLVPSAVEEPGSLVILGLGFVVLRAMRRRKLA